MDLFHRIFKPLLFERIPTPSPYTYRMTEYGDQEAVKNYCIDELEKLLQDQAEEIAGLIIEPLVQGAKRYHYPPSWLFKSSRTIVQEVQYIIDL